MPPDITVRAPTSADAAAISDLHARVFGPGRFARTAYRIREETAFSSRYCLIAIAGDGSLAGALRLSLIAIGGKRGALLLGPIAIEPARTNTGIGRGLIRAAMTAARDDGIALIVLVGNLDYYGKLGFKPVPPGQIRLPGPVDYGRLLAAELADGALAGFSGLITADNSATS